MLQWGPYLNNTLDCRREGEEVSVGGTVPSWPPEADHLDTRPRRRERAYLLPACHPVSDGGNQDGAEQDLGGVVDQERDWNQRQLLVALKHDFQHGDTCTKRKYLCLQFHIHLQQTMLKKNPLTLYQTFCLINYNLLNYDNVKECLIFNIFCCFFVKFCHLLDNKCTYMYIIADFKIKMC